MKNKVEELPIGQLASLYERSFGERETYLNRGRECAKLTIPTLLPDSGSNFSTVYSTPFQSIGSRGVNHLASKLLLTLLPPNSPFFRLTIDDFDLAELMGDPEQRGAVEEGFSRIERSAMNEIETSAYRVPVFEALKHLITTGNCLLYLPDKGGMRVFHLDRYVVKRDPMGNLLYLITKETLSAKTVPSEARVALGLPHRRS